jgi:cytochrome P450
VRVSIPAHPMITQTDSITVRTTLSVAPPRHSPSVIPPIRTTNDATHPKDPHTERRLTDAPVEEVARAFGDMRRYVTELIAAKRAQPGEDLLTAMIQANEDGDRLTDDELLAHVELLILAGQDTVANMISNSVELDGLRPRPLRERTVPAQAHSCHARRTETR